MTENEISCKLDLVCEKLNEIIEILIYQSRSDSESKKELKKKYDKLRESKRQSFRYDYDGYDP